MTPEPHQTGETSEPATGEGVPDPDAWLLVVSGPRRGEVMRARLPLSVFADPDVQLLPADADDPEQAAANRKAIERAAATRRRNALIGLATVAATVGIVLLGGALLLRAVLPERGGDSAPASANVAGADPLVGLGEDCQVTFDRVVLSGLPISALGRAGVSVRPLSPAALTVRAELILPVHSSSAVSCGRPSGTVGLLGGIRLGREGHVADLRRLRLDGASGRLRRRSPGQPIREAGPLRMDVDHGRWISGSDLVSYRAPLQLTEAGAAELNRALGAAVVRPGQSFGTVTLSGRVRAVSGG